MAGHSRMRRLAKPLELCLDAFLLASFFVQAFLLGCFLTLGHLPLPETWVERLVRQQLPQGMELEAAGYDLYPDGAIHLDAPVLRLNRIEQALFECESARLRIDFFSNQESAGPAANLVITGGRLYLPSVYSPSGQRLALLRNANASLSLTRAGFTLDSFAAKHQDVRVRGRAQMATAQPQVTERADLDRLARQFFTQANRILRKTSEVEGLKTPTLFFFADRDTQGAFEVQAHLTSRELDRGELQAHDLSLQTRFKFAGGKRIDDATSLLQVARIHSRDFDITGESLKVLIQQEPWQTFEAGHWPDLELAAASLAVAGVELAQPKLKLNFRQLPEFTFSGTTGALNGAARFYGSANIEDRSAQVRATGSMDLLALVSEDLRKRLPSMRFTRAPYYDLFLDLGADMTLKEATLRSEIDDLTVAGIHFDHIRTEGSYRDGQFDFPRTFIQRDWQWLDLGFAFNRDDLEYRVQLYGSAKPDDYDTILPRWWGRIFKDFDFEETEQSLGDFIIYGNAAEKAADFFYGHVQAQDVSYKGVRVDQGELRVRGRGPYAEIFRMNLRQPDGWARGSIRFTSRLDEVRGPASLRLNLETRLGLPDARKLFEPKIRAILDDFETTAPIEASVEGVVFNQAYPEFDGMSFLDVRASTAQPLRYKSLPLDHLRFQLFGRNGVTHLRDLKVGFAGGALAAQADISTSSTAASPIRFEGDLKGAEQAAVEELLAEVLQQPVDSETSKKPRQDGQLDLKLHAEGRIEEITEFSGYGRFELRNEQLASIQLFGPISKLLERSQLGYTTFALERMQGDFALNEAVVNFDKLRIDGPRTRIEAPGRLDLSDQSLDMRVSVYLFRNAGNPKSQLRKLTDLVSGPIPNLLEFELSGDLQNQNWRSIYDPRNLLPQL